MKLRTFGRTGTRVSEVGFGAWALGGNEHGNSYGPTKDEESVAAVHRSLELGCNFFDSADVYGWGHSEAVLGKALEGRRDEVVIATKVGGDFYHGGVKMNFDPDYIRFALEKSLERLKTKYVDVYQLHNPPGEAVLDLKIQRLMEKLKQEQKIRVFGISVHEPEEAVEAIESGKADAIQIPFSLFRQEWITEILPLARKRNVAVIAREPLANGFLTGKYTGKEDWVQGDIRHRMGRRHTESQAKLGRGFSSLARDGRTQAQAALKFVLSFPEISTTIPGIKSPAQAEENIGASSAPELSRDEMATARQWWKSSTR
ncbi:MAG TPA: aldo/keto reductase [Thermoplasmata archaeon]|nr:aldo/keto reductase [Thermoplasmata archaeon]